MELSGEQKSVSISQGNQTKKEVRTQFKKGGLRIDGFFKKESLQ